MIENYRGIKPVIHPSVFLHERSTIIGEVFLGAESSVFPSAILRGDQGPLRVGEKTNIQDGAICHATRGLSTMSIGDRVTVGHGAIIHGAHIGNDCLIGMGAILLDNAEISNWTIVGAGSLVPSAKKFPEGVLLIGSPAKAIREITKEEQLLIEHSWKVYAELALEYQNALNECSKNGNGADRE